MATSSSTTTIEVLTVDPTTDTIAMSSIGSSSTEITATIGDSTLNHNTDKIATSSIVVTTASISGVAVNTTASEITVATTPAVNSGDTSNERFNETMCTCSKGECMYILCWGFLIVSTDVELSCAVIAGGVGGVMTLIIVSQSVIILILLLRQKKATNSQMRFP